jgi:diguanylate cyclase (GGDEF)-like protein
MDRKQSDSAAHEEDATSRLRGITLHDALSVDLVSAYAGDRPLTDKEAAALASLRDSRGDLFYSDLLYAITHQFFAAEEAPDLWREMLRHKCELSETLGRNVQVVVATLDYLTNITGEVRLPTLVTEGHIAEIVSQSMHDGLTGLFNHSCFHELLDLEIKRFLRHGTVVSLILLDIDDFKRVNDRCGHPEGDRVLRTLAATLRRVTRESDICSRYGGEEFAIILPLTGIAEAAEIAERIRAEAAGIPVGEQFLTVSLGVAVSSTATGDADALVKLADQALYRAKEQGKNRVVVAG